MKEILTSVNQDKLSKISLSTQKNNLLFSNIRRNSFESNQLQNLVNQEKAPLPQSMLPKKSPARDTRPIKQKPTSSFHASYSLTPQSWLLNFNSRELLNTTCSLKLTAIESLLIKTLIMCNDRICSKQELILGIEKNPHSYSGLEMSLSRLQHKFKSTFNERLFRSVRNRGYCLVQDVRINN